MSFAGNVLNHDASTTATAGAEPRTGAHIHLGPFFLT